MQTGSTTTWWPPPRASSCGPGDKPDGFLLGIGPDPEQLLTVDGLRRNLKDILGGTGVPPHELEFFVSRLLVFVTSCDERRYGQWEHVSWWDFVEAANKSKAYQNVLAAGLTRNLVAAKETVASTRTIGNMGEAFVYNIMGRGNDGALDRVLNAPTNDAWIDPWVKLLRKLGVEFRVGYEVDSLELAKGKVRRSRSARPPRAAPAHRGRLVHLRNAGRAGAPALGPEDPPSATLRWS